MKKFVLIPLAVILICTLVLGSCSKQAATTTTVAPKTIVVRLANELGPSDHLPIVLEKLVKRISEETGGRIKFEQYTAGSLYSQADAITALQAGDLELAIGGAQLSFLIPEWDVMANFPFLFKDMDHYERFMETATYKAIEGRMEAMGIKPLTKCYAGGPNNFEQNKRPINKFEDLKGLKFAAQPSPLVIEAVTALGATPVSIAPPELPGAIETGMVDGHMGAMWPMAFIDYVKLEPYLCVTTIGWFQLGIVASTKWWNTLPSDVQQTISRYMTDAVKEYRQMVKADNDKYFEMYKAAPNTKITYMSNAEMLRCLQQLGPIKEKLVKDPNVRAVFDAADAIR